MRRIRMLVLVVGCAAAVSGIALAGESKPMVATWEGDTEEGRLVIFDVEKSGSKYEVNEFSTDSTFRCSDGTTRFGSFYNLSAKINKKGKFSIDRSNPPSVPPWEQHVEGKFTSKKKAEGTVSGSLTDLVDHSITCEGKKVHWSAKATSAPPTAARDRDRRRPGG